MLIQGKQALSIINCLFLFKKKLKSFIDLRSEDSVLYNFIPVGKNLFKNLKSVTAKRIVSIMPCIIRIILTHSFNFIRIPFCEQN